MNDEIYFSINDFIESLKDLSVEEMTIKTEGELKRIEMFKIRVLEDNIKTNTDAAVYVSGQIDAYITKLHQLLGELPANRLSNEIFSSDALQRDRELAFARIKELGQDEAPLK